MHARRCLTIAGSDPSGGAGIQGDLKTFASLGAYGMAVITALTAQNTCEVRSSYSIPAHFVQAQLDAVLDDIPCDAAKTGMLANAEIIDAVAELLGSRTRFSLVVDPVMVATSGGLLLEESAIATLKRKLFPLGTIITPNAHEAEALCGFRITGVETAKEAARMLHGLGTSNVLVKGGHFEEDTVRVVDVLYDGTEFESIESERIDTPHTHGSGCALSAAICVGLASGKSVSEAVRSGHDYVHRAIVAAHPLGKGHGPVNHLAGRTSTPLG